MEDQTYRSKPTARIRHVKGPLPTAQRPPEYMLSRALLGPFGPLQLPLEATWAVSRGTSKKTKANWIVWQQHLTLLSSTGCEVMEPGPGEGMSYCRAGRRQGTVCSGSLLGSRKPRDALHPMLLWRNGQMVYEQEKRSIPNKNWAWFMRS